MENESLTLIFDFAFDFGHSIVEILFHGSLNVAIGDTFIEKLFVFFVHLDR